MRNMKIVLSVFLTAVIFLVSIGCSQNRASEESLIKITNNSFEESDNIMDSGWEWWSSDNKGGVEIVPDARDGKLAAKIIHDGEEEFSFSNSSKIDVIPGENFQASIWIKSEDSKSIVLAIVALSEKQVTNWNIARGYNILTNDKDNTWKELRAFAQIPEGCDQIYLRIVGYGPATIIVDNALIHKTSGIKPEVKGGAKKRVEEELNRGIVAMYTDDGVYIGWRLLKSDKEDIAFNVYRQEAESKPKKLNSQPITKTTDFFDTEPPANSKLTYWVTPVIKGKEGEKSEKFAIKTDSESLENQFISIKTEGKAERIAVADLDGDGAYDYIIKTGKSIVDPYEAPGYWRKSERTFKLIAYRSTGEKMWSYDLGWAIEQGIWYSPMIAHDLNGDGKAEVALKIGEGDPRDAEGKVTSRNEYVAIFNGETGEEIARADWPSQDGFESYNWYSRNQLGIAYLDGKTPCLMVARGTYGLMKLEAYQLHKGRLEKLWDWQTNEEANTWEYSGQGAHSMRVADIDEDGKDEILLGSCAINDNGNGLWSTGLGHCDHAYLGDIDPTRPGLEVYYGYEKTQNENGACLVDAKTGEIIWGIDEPTFHIHGVGLCSDIDSSNTGMETYSHERDLGKFWIHSAKGELLDENNRLLSNTLNPKALYWNDDLQREIFYQARIYDYDDNKVYPGLFPGTHLASVDLFGDWREELIVSFDDELRIYTTVIPAADRRVTLMQDPIYRRDVAHVSMGYVQDPMTSYCLDNTNKWYK